VFCLSIVRQLVEEISRDEEARRILIEEIATHIAINRKVRHLILTAIIRDIATRDDVRREVENVRNELREEIRRVREELRKDIDGLRLEVIDIRDRVSRLEGQMLLFIRLFIAFNVPILVGVIGTLLLLLWRTITGAPIP